MAKASHYFRALAFLVGIIIGRHIFALEYWPGIFAIFAFQWPDFHQGRAGLESGATGTR
jgi:hypothetical protein